MTDVPSLGRGLHLDFASPLSGARADRIAADLALAKPGKIIDFGCGWGELLLRVVAASPGSRGVGVDLRAGDLARGRANAVERGLADRVEFVEGPAGEYGGRAGVVMSVGAYQAYGKIDGALGVLHEAVEAGGRLLFGAEFWEVEPPAERLAKMWPGIGAEDCTDLGGLVDLAVAAGFRPLGIETVTADEWAQFETGLVRDAEEWLLANPGHPGAAELTGKLDAQRNIWLRGHRGVMGFAYLTLARLG